MKRIAFLTGIALITVLSAAPDALASHCLRCKLAQGELTCVPALGSTPGYPICEEGPNSCVTSGTQCAPHLASVAPLASEYQVALVERLDEPHRGANDTLVAQTEVAQSMNR